MRHVSPGFADVTAQAQQLAAAGELPAARRLLGDALATADRDPARAPADLAEAAALLARILVASGDAPQARAWAALAYPASRRLHGPADERTVVAAATLAAILHRLGEYSRAGLLYRDVVAQLSALDGPDSRRVLAAQADLATVEHARGECGTAQARLGDAHHRHEQAYGTADVAGIKMLARLGAMNRDCGRFAAAQQQFDEARRRCAEHLPGDHPMAAQIAALARAPGDPAHVCRPAPGAGTADAPPPGPAGSAGSDPAPAPVDGQPPAPVGAPGDPQGTNPSPGNPAVAGPVGSPLSADRAALGATGSGPPAAGTGTGTGWDDDDLAAYGWQEHAATDGTPGRTRTDDELEPWWPPESGPTAPLPPPVLDDLRPQRVSAPAGAGPAAAVAVRRSASRLPVLVPRSGGQRSRHPALVVAAGTAIVALGTAAVALGLASARDDPAAAPAVTPSAGAAPAPVPADSDPASTGPTAAAPGDVALRDNRDSVTLEWTYPAGSDGPVLIAGGRDGQALRAFQELPAGSRAYVVYGLNEGSDYCFSISVVYAADSVATAPPVCTARRPR